MERPYEGLAGNISLATELKPGQSIPVPVPNPPIKIGPVVPDSGLRIIYALGWVEYDDDFGTHRRTAFCRRFDGFTGRFQPVKDRDYEHEE